MLLSFKRVIRVSLILFLGHVSLNGNSNSAGIFAQSDLAATKNTQEDIDGAKERLQQGAENQRVLTQILSISRDNDRHRELEIVSDQADKLNMLGGEYGRELVKLKSRRNQMTSELRGMLLEGKEAEAQKLALEAMSLTHSVSKTFLDKAEGILLPHQSKRVRQISKQEEFRRRSKGGNEFGILLAVAFEIGLSQQEKDALKKKSAMKTSVFTTTWRN